ncbi:MAG TPA: hypothetical protein DCG38_05095 [Eubacteriaceae bacterium]|nr:hypothetical protein [Eubacteriaceae bacterium]
MTDIANFISLIGFPAFMAYYIFTKYAEERKNYNSFNMLIEKIENLVDKWNYTMSMQNNILNKLVEKIDKLIEYDTIIMERISQRRDKD